MLKLTALLLMLCSVIPLNAQSDSLSPIQFFGSFEIPSGEEIEGLISASTASDYLISTKPGVIYLRPISDSTGTPKRVLSIKSNDEKKIIRHEMVGDSLICLVKSVNKNKSTNYDVVVYTLFNDQLAEAFRKTININNRPNEKNAEKLHFDIDDRGKQCAILRQMAFDVSPKTVLEIDVIKFRGDKMTKYSLPLPYGADDFRIEDVEISTQGILNFTAVSGVRLNSPFLKKHLIYSFNPAIKELHEFDLSKDKAYIQAMLLKNKQGEMDVLTSYTKDPMEQSHSHGYGWIKIDSMGTSLTSKTTSPFSPLLTNALRIDARSSKDAVEHLFADKIVRLADIPIGLFHQQYRDQVCTTDPRTGILTCTDQYHHDGIIVQYLDSSSRPIVIDRVQVDYDREGPYLGYISEVVNDRLLLLYNDHQRNTSIAAEREMSNPSRSNIRYVAISSNGSYISNSIDLNIGRGFVLLPGVDGYQKNGYLFRLYSNGRDFRIGVLDTQTLME